VTLPAPSEATDGVASLVEDGRVANGEENSMLIETKDSRTRKGGE
jgi:hypothetical protein